jgi:hypothetical protein
MNRLVGVAMFATLAAIVGEITQDDVTSWVAWTSLGLAGLPVLLATAHTFPGAVRLGARTDPPEAQGLLAQSILRDHLICLASIGCLLVLQLGFAG